MANSIIIFSNSFPQCYGLELVQKSLKDTRAETLKKISIHLKAGCSIAFEFDCPPGPSNPPSEMSDLVMLFSLTYDF